MIVNKDKNFYQHSEVPKDNITEWSDIDVYVVDETTEAGKSLAVKIASLWPYYEFIIDGGALKDVRDTRVKVICKQNVAVNETFDLTVTCEGEAEARAEIITLIDKDRAMATHEIKLKKGSGNLGLSFLNAGTYQINVTTKTHGDATFKVVVL